MADVAEIPADLAMEDPESPASVEAVVNAPSEENFGEPAAKKARVREPSPETTVFKLEERLSGVLSCAVCLDLPSVAIYQVLSVYNRVTPMTSISSKTSGYLYLL